MKRLIFACTLLINFAAHAQNVTIDYQAWNPSNPPCNVFASATNVPATGAASGFMEH